MSLRDRRGAAQAARVALLITLPACLSHEYRISGDELRRLAAMPPSLRGERVRVVQEIGVRRGEPLLPQARHPAASTEVAATTAVASAPTNEADQPHVDEIATHAHIAIQVGLGQAPSDARNLASGQINAGARPDEPLYASPVAAAAHPATPAGVSTDPVTTAPVTRTTPSDTAPEVSASADDALPDTTTRSGGGANDLVSAAVVVTAVATAAAAGLTATEGLRYDGYVRMGEGQPLHLRYANGERRAIPLAGLTPEDARAADGALVMDDEGYGLDRLGRAPLDRRGFAFKLDLGLSQNTLAHYTVLGLSSRLQLGYFLARRFGLLVCLDLSRGEDVDQHPYARHSLGLEAQIFPLSLGAMHVGLHGRAGAAILADASLDRSGVPAWGGGAILEFELTTRLAITLRGDVTYVRRAPGDWSPAATATIGLAVY